VALLDLKAKVLGVPCYELLGGAYRKDILLYANYWFTGGGHNEADYAAQARRVMDAGFTGLKFDPFAHTNYFYGEDLASNLTLTAEQQDLAFNVSKAVREAVGPPAHHDRDTRHAELPGCRQDGGTLGKA